MSKIAVNETYGGNLLRKAIDYFCHLAVAPEFLARIEKGDKAFAASEFLPQMRWLKDVNDDIYDPTYTDMLRVAFTSEFGRGKLQDLVALLSGRNFETKQYEEAIAEESFGRLKKGILALHQQDPLRPHHDDPALGGLRDERPDRRPERRQLRLHPLPARPRREACRPPTSNGWCGAGTPCRSCAGATPAAPRPPSTSTSARSRRAGSRPTPTSVIENELPESFWTGMLPQLMDTSSSNSPYFLAYQAAQVKLGDKGFLSRDITVRDLLLNRSDVHHVYPTQASEEAGPRRAAATTRSPTSSSPRARSTSPSATRRPRCTSGSWPSSATAARRSTAASPTTPNCAPTCA